MLEIKKVVKRRTCREYNCGRKLVVMLEPGDILAMREAGRKYVYRAGLGRIFVQLARWYVAEQAELKRKLRKERRLK
jgi:hypothetical protein